MTNLYVTTSWDDGSHNDIEIANLLKKYGLKGTFYVPTDNNARTLSDDSIKHLSIDQEIGSHASTHKDLTLMTNQQIFEELRTSKRVLEVITQKEIVGLSYPYGRFNQEVVKMAINAGYLFGRSTQYNFNIFHKKDPFNIDVSCYLSNKESKDNILSLFLKMGLKSASILNWKDKAMDLFDRALVEGGIFHLWGHSNELVDDLEDLSEVLSQISFKKNCIYVTNKQLWRELNKNSPHS
jgi:peptidoglycan-N-acetylglucosamine deacetylase